MVVELDRCISAMFPQVQRDVVMVDIVGFGHDHARGQYQWRYKVHQMQDQID